ncbi:acyltransferase family protein [Pseudalkalibacillus sp. R45]|uniref:acyltransferase family protein n=1 Tax=Pseudalkalibacillus sp. R45 TaxID=3457433 RepID=UPI003FCE68AE
MSNRINWIDTAKGIGILSVVLGHSVMEISLFLYWFHMPLFFFLSGFLYKPNDQFIIKKFSVLLIPYLTFFLIITGIRYLDEGVPTFEGFMKDGLNLLYGGEVLSGYYGVFWFVTCLFALSIAYHLIFQKIKSWKVWLGIIGMCYLLSYEYSLYLKDLTVMWNVDVVLYAIVFYALGHIYKRFKQTINTYSLHLTFFSLIVIGGALLAHLNNSMYYRLDMKSQLYNHFGLDLILPLSCIIILITISKFLSQYKVSFIILNTLGTASLTIMYLHLVFLIILPKYTGLPLWSVIISSIIFPAIFHTLAQNITLLKIFCLGQLHRYFPKKYINLLYRTNV